MKNQVVLGLGSNRSFSLKSEINGEDIILSPDQVLKSACEKLQKVLEPESVKFSSIYKTKAMYHTDQDDFYNMVVLGNYEGSPEELLKTVNKIEAEFGRNRDKEFRNGPRTLDIDIELFGDLTVNQPDLEIPHKKIRERAFVLTPLLEIFPECAEPISGTFYKEYFDKLPDQGVEYFSVSPL